MYVINYLIFTALIRTKRIVCAYFILCLIFTFYFFVLYVVLTLSNQITYFDIDCYRTFVDIIFVDNQMYKYMLYE